MFISKTFFNSIKKDIFSMSSVPGQNKSKTFTLISVGFFHTHSLQEPKGVNIQFLIQKNKNIYPSGTLGGYPGMVFLLRRGYFCKQKKRVFKENFRYFSSDKSFEQKENQQYLPSRTTSNVPQHIKLQDSLINPEGKPLNIKGGHHIYTLVYDSVKENTQSSEDARLKIKEALQSIYFEASCKKNNKSIVNFSLSPHQKKKSSETLAQAIYYNQTKQEIIVRFVACERFQISFSNLSKFNLYSPLSLREPKGVYQSKIANTINSPFIEKFKENNESQLIQPRAYIDITNRRNFYNYMLDIKKNKDLDCLYFISSVKKPSKKTFLYYFSLPSHRQSLQFLQSKNKNQQITSFDIEEDFLNSLEKGVGKEFSIDFPFKFKIKFEIGSLFSQQLQKKRSNSSFLSSTNQKIKNQFDLKNASWKKKFSKKKIKIVKKSKSLLFYFPLFKKKYILVSSFIPVFKLVKNISFTKKYMQQLRLLFIEGKVNIRAQRSLKSYNSCKNL